MADHPVFDPDLYRGTARYYDEYRLRYPDELIDELCRRVAVTGTGRLLDLACGPGTATFALCDRFADVWAVDQEAEAVEFGARKADDLGVRNIRWIVGRAEDVDPGEVFELVTIGTAFHRLHRMRIAELAMEWLRPGGHLALLWSSTPLNGTADWQLAFTEIVVDWMERLGAIGRVPSDLVEHLTDVPNQEVLARAGFEPVERFEVAQPHRWTVDELIGFVYSTSLLPRPVLGDQADAFEADVVERLRARDLVAPYREDATFACDLARRPAA